MLENKIQNKNIKNIYEILETTVDWGEVRDDTFWYYHYCHAVFMLQLCMLICKHLSGCVCLHLVNPAEIWIAKLQWHQTRAMVNYKQIYIKPIQFFLCKNQTVILIFFIALFTWEDLFSSFRGKHFLNQNVSCPIRFN